MYTAVIYKFDILQALHIHFFYILYCTVKQFYINLLYCTYIQVCNATATQYTYLTFCNYTQILDMYEIVWMDTQSQRENKHKKCESYSIIQFCITKKTVLVPETSTLTN